MKNGFWIFLAVFVALGGSWCGFVLAPELQLGSAKQTTILNSSDVYPVGRLGEATQGASVYRANGCAACHTEQVRQTGTTCEGWLTDTGKTPQAGTKVCGDIGVNMTDRAWPPPLPKTILTGLTKEEADSASAKITAAGGKTEIHIVATRPAIAPGRELRQRLAGDYL